ncbi:MAG: TIGR02757 family protein [Bernardetiaceae bacterium]|jgi:uncharacterized protein (TIGR02757 family)|nr:TIGR02757 family protein [Bernardetiaceae bacterium]
MKPPSLKDFLEEKVAQYNQPGFIKDDPILIPHQFTAPPDIEIMGFFAAVLAWGQRGTIISKCQQLIQLFDNQPHQFILHHSAPDLKPLAQFCHRTFNGTDLLYFVHFFRQYYQQHASLETAFARHLAPGHATVEAALAGFHRDFFALPEAPARTRKHVATPARKAACKRLCMYLRWMVRRDPAGVDFGLWARISPAQLVCPLDLHVERTARRLGLLARPQTDWLAALELTAHLRQFDPQDPTKYDFALFGLGLENSNRRR